MTASPRPPREPQPASRRDGPPRHDPRQRLTAARIQHTNRYWLLMWGTHSRRYYAFPLFTVPPGLLVSATDPARLLDRMRHAEAAAARMAPLPLPPPGMQRGR